jgi:lysophospholipase L1-like esterase
MKSVVLNLLLALIVGVVAVLMLEGVYSVSNWGTFRRSLTFEGYKIARQALVKGKWPSWVIQHSQRPNTLIDEPNFTKLLDREELNYLVPKLKNAAVGLGNSDYHELQRDAAAINTHEGECLVQKPNLRKTLTYLRSNLFNPLDPLTIFFDRDRELDPEIKKLVETYGVREVAFTTNEVGERVTLPAITADRKVIVAGDSVAVGEMVDDSETLSSQLQALDPKRQFINVGIGSASAADIICALKKVGARYNGVIDELIYIYCENDLHAGAPYGTPEEVVTWLAQFAKDQHISKVVVVYAPYIYNIVPQFTRFHGYRGWEFPTHAVEREALARLVEKSGFSYFDLSYLALEEIKRDKTQFAALRVFSDHVHLSPYGIARLAQRLCRDGHSCNAEH